MLITNNSNDNIQAQLLEGQTSQTTSHSIQ